MSQLPIAIGGLLHQKVDSKIIFILVGVSIYSSSQSNCIISTNPLWSFSNDCWTPNIEYDCDQYDEQCSLPNSDNGDSYSDDDPDNVINDKDINDDSTQQVTENAYQL